MSGRAIMVAMLAFAAVFGAVLWYVQTRAFYEEVSADSVEIAGTRYAVTDFRGIDAATSPLKRRACFRMEAPPQAAVAPHATPLVAPGWFDCFDAGALTASLASGEATAYLAGREDFEGIDRIVAVYPDGRAYEWRQLNEKYAN